MAKHGASRPGRGRRGAQASKAVVGERRAGRPQNLARVPWRRPEAGDHRHHRRRISNRPQYRSHDARIWPEGTIWTPSGRFGPWNSCAPATGVSLVLEDPGAEPLEPLLGAPMETSRFLRLALALAAALRGLHEGGLIHKDVNPANILVDEEAGRAWLTGFGIASRLPRERHAPSPPALIAGTLGLHVPRTDRAHEPLRGRPQRPLRLGDHLVPDVDRRAPVRGRRPPGMGPLPHSPSAGHPGGAARGPGAVVRHHHAASREKRGGALPDRRGPGGRSWAVPVAMALPWPDRSIPTGRGRRLGPVADSRDAVRAGARGRGPAGGVRQGWWRRAPPNWYWCQAIPVSASHRW